MKKEDKLIAWLDKAKKIDSRVVKELREVQ